MIIYCLKCKQKTETLDNVELKSSKGTCSVCGTKNSFSIIEGSQICSRERLQFE